MCVCRTSENCKSVVLQDKCNIEIFLSPDIVLASVIELFCGAFNSRFDNPLNSDYFFINIETISMESSI